VLCCVQLRVQRSVQVEAESRVHYTLLSQVRCHRRDSKQGVGQYKPVLLPEVAALPLCLPLHSPALHWLNPAVTLVCLGATAAMTLTGARTMHCLPAAWLACRRLPCPVLCAALKCAAGY
jgi:hypothetical protein